MTVNELSNTIDLESTLIRAEALFRRFQRTIEAIDKKHNFPTPSVRQHRPVEQPSAPQASASSSSDAKGKRQSVGDAIAQGIGAEKEKVISPELRTLLSRKIDKLDKTQIKEHGNGVGNPA